MALIPIKTASETGYCDCVCGCYELASLRDEDTSKSYCPACGKNHLDWNTGVGLSQPAPAKQSASYGCGFTATSALRGSPGALALNSCYFAVDAHFLAKKDRARGLCSACPVKCLVMSRAVRTSSATTSGGCAAKKLCWCSGQRLSS